MEDYPRNLTELEERFATEEACREYLFRLRRPDGFRCPGCGHGSSWPLRGVPRQCAECAYQSSVMAGTIFQDPYVAAVVVLCDVVVCYRPVFTGGRGWKVGYMWDGQGLPQLFWKSVRH